MDLLPDIICGRVATVAARKPELFVNAESAGFLPLVNQMPPVVSRGWLERPRTE